MLNVNGCKKEKKSLDTAGVVVPGEHNLKYYTYKVVL